MYVDVGRELLLTLETGGAGTPFDEANSFIGVGDSSTATADDMTDLQAAVNKAYFPMDAGYPQLDGNEMVYQATVPTDEANFSWQETALFNGDDPPTAVMHSRIVEDLGTKTIGEKLLVFRVKIP